MILIREKEYILSGLAAAVEERNKEINRVIAGKKWLNAGIWCQRGSLIFILRGVYTEKYCNICTRFGFWTKLNETINGNLSGTQRYLITHIVLIPKKTYWQYITNSESNYIYNYNKMTDTDGYSSKAIVFMSRIEQLYSVGQHGCWRGC